MGRGRDGGWIEKGGGSVEIADEEGEAEGRD